MKFIEDIFLFIKKKLRNYNVKKVCVSSLLVLILLSTMMIIASARGVEEYSATTTLIIEDPIPLNSLESIIDEETEESSESLLTESLISSEEMTSEETEEVDETKESVAPTNPPIDSGNTGSSGGGNYNDFDEYVGRFKIPAVGVNVACYASSSQATVDAADSAAYFYTSGHVTIADHKHQGFSAIRSCSKGMKASLSTSGGTKNYICVDRINGHNTGYELTDSSYNSIDNMYPGTLVLYTCNENWQNVTIVFLKLEGAPDPEPEGEPVYGCAEGEHLWTEWKLEWAGESGGRKFHWESHECKICYEEEWELIYDTEAPEDTETSEETIPPSEESSEESTEIPSEESSSENSDTSEEIGSSESSEESNEDINSSESETEPSEEISSEVNSETISEEVSIEGSESSEEILE